MDYCTQHPSWRYATCFNALCLRWGRRLWRAAFFFTISALLDEIICPSYPSFSNFHMRVRHGAMFPTGGIHIFALALIHIFGMNSMYGLVYRNDYIGAFLKLRDHEPHALTNSDISLLITFTGNRPLDKLLTFVFAKINDGSTP